MENQTKNQQKLAVVYAILAAAFYAINFPVSKILLKSVGPATMSALLYLGAGIGIFFLAIFHNNNKETREKLSKKDLPFVVGMIILDIIAPILLMLGIKYGSPANASLLSNFEIVATTIIALCFFKEKVSKLLWLAIFLVTLSSTLLSFESVESIKLSFGSLLVLLATTCWGIENNCTRKISSKNTYEIVIIKGIFSGLGSATISYFKSEDLPSLEFILYALLLGFIAYGLSIFLYVRAQNILGSAKTSAFYAIAPFVGVLLSFLLFKEPLSATYFTALMIMIAGSVLIVKDTMKQDASQQI